MQRMEPIDIDSVTFRLTLTGRQARIIMHALEFLSRMHMGQVNEIKNALGYHKIPLTEQMERYRKVYGKLPDHMTRGSDYPDIQLDVSDTLDHLKEVLFPELRSNESWGIANTQIPEDARVSWDLYQVIRHHTSWESVGWPEKRDWKTMITVNYDEPMKTSTAELAKIETVKKKKGDRT